MRIRHPIHLFHSVQKPSNLKRGNIQGLIIIHVCIHIHIYIDTHIYANVFFYVYVCMYKNIYPASLTCIYIYT